MNFVEVLYPGFVFADYYFNVLSRRKCYVGFVLRERSVLSFFRVGIEFFAGMIIYINATKLIC